MDDCGSDKGGLLMDAPSRQNNWKCVWEILFNYACAVEFQPSASGDDDKNSSGDEIANVNFFYNIAHVEASAYAHWTSS